MAAGEEAVVVAAAVPFVAADAVAEAQLAAAAVATPAVTPPTLSPLRMRAPAPRLAEPVATTRARSRARSARFRRRCSTRRTLS